MGYEKILSYYLNDQDEIKKKNIYTKIIINFLNMNLNDALEKNSGNATIYITHFIYFECKIHTFSLYSSLKITCKIVL